MISVIITRLMILFVLFSSMEVFTTSYFIYKSYPDQVIIHNKTKYDIEFIISDMENRDGSKFLTSENYKGIITIIEKVQDKGILGMAFPWITGNCTIEIDPHIDWDEYPYTIRHEIGHCFGMLHNEADKSSIMYYEATDEQRTEESLKRFSEDLKKKRLK